MSNKYALRCLSINQPLSLVKFFFEVRIPDRIIFNQVNISMKKVLQCEFEIKIVVSIFRSINFILHKELHFESSQS